MDIVKLARERIDRDTRTHWQGCERDHRECLIQRMADEIERLREENEREEERRQSDLSTDAARWRWLVRYASLGFDGSPSWNAVIRVPVFDASDNTITKLVDRARAAYQPRSEEE